MQNNDIPTFDRKLGRKIKEARQLHGITQSRLGNILGVTYQQIQKYESGQNRITAENLDRIAQALELPLSYFLAVDDEARNQWLFPADTLRLAGNINDLPSDLIRTHIKRLVRSINAAWHERIET